MQLLVEHAGSGLWTSKIEVSTPEGTVEVFPVVKPGWVISIGKRELPQSLWIPSDDGGYTTEVISNITWTASVFILLLFF